MIGIVIVSHSQALASGVRELAQQMVRDTVPIAVAGGMDDPNDPIGTDPFRVLAAIESVYSEEGVIVLMDLGSAVLSAETALDFLPTERRQHVHLCAAPLVEGVIAAAVRAMSGSPLADILAEANGALSAKAAQLAPAPPIAAAAESPEPEPQPAGADQATLVIRVEHPLGLHARPAVRLVNTLGHYAARVTITKEQVSVDAKSLNQILTLMIEQGDILSFRASGPEASQALAALRRLAAANFDEPQEEPLQLPAAARSAGIDRKGDYSGVPVSPGMGYGPAMLYRPLAALVRETIVADPTAEWRLFHEALATAQVELDLLQQESEQRIGQVEAAIFTAQSALLNDPDLQQLAYDLIVDHRLNAEAAWMRVTGAVARRLANAERPYWQQRMADVQDIQTRVLRLLSATPDVWLAPERPTILVAADLAPTVMAQLRPEQVIGVLLEQGGATSHSAILARSLGIPVVAGVAGLMNRIHEGQTLALDGYSGRIWLNPDRALCAAIDELQTRGRLAKQAAQTAARLPALLRDGKRIEVCANLSSLAEATQVLAHGADGVGLLRSEFLFMHRPTPPDEEEQYNAYQGVARALGGRPLTIRTLDVGGDKGVNYLTLPSAPNPALGWRGVRYWLDHPEQARIQLRAILRAAAGYPVKLMFPMVSTLEEVWGAIALVESVRLELRAAKIAHGETVETGIMVETPAAVWMAAQLARQVAFFSIGANDLTQYIMAADRTNPQVAGLVHQLQPSVLRAIQQVVQAAHQAGIRVAFCGELAGDPRVAALLVGLGVDELSMNLPMVAGVKAALRELTLPQAIGLAEGALTLETANQIEQYLLRQLPG